MTALAIVLIVAAAGVLAVWTSRHLMISRQHKSGFVLTEDYARKNPGGGNAPPVSVIVAAKDERDNIEQCVRTMLGQDYPNFEMIVANDRSTDGTAAIVERIAREDKRLGLVNIEHLPDGWCGKNNAMQTAIARTGGEWICMIDADCWQTSAGTLSAAMRYAAESGADMLSILPSHQMRTFWENVVQPVCSGIMMIWFHPDKVNDPAKPHAYANGAFMLIKRSAYEAVGTHEAVKDKLNEDMHMAVLVKSAGLRLRVVRNDGLYLLRMYTSFGEILRGWSRIFYGTFGTRKRLGVSLAVLAVMGLLPYAAAVLGFVAAAAGAQPGWLFLSCGILGAVAAGVQLSVIWRFCPMVGARSSLAWTYPLGCVVGIAALAGAIGKLRKGATVTWRNTTYTSS